VLGGSEGMKITVCCSVILVRSPIVLFVNILPFLRQRINWDQKVELVCECYICPC
jgi:hypothetical protein